MGWLVKSIASGVLVLAMLVCIGLLAVNRVRVVDIVVLAASGAVLAVWGAGYVRKFGRAGPLDDEERKAAEAELGPGVPVPLSGTADRQGPGARAAAGSPAATAPGAALEQPPVFRPQTRQVWGGQDAIEGGQHPLLVARQAAADRQVVGRVVAAEEAV